MDQPAPREKCPPIYVPNSQPEPGEVPNPELFVQFSAKGGIGDPINSGFDLGHRTSREVTCRGRKASGREWKSREHWTPERQDDGLLRHKVLVGRV